MARFLHLPGDAHRTVTITSVRVVPGSCTQ